VSFSASGSSLQMSVSDLVSSSEDDRTDSRSSHDVMYEQVSRLIKISERVTSEGYYETLEDA